MFADEFQEPRTVTETQMCSINTCLLHRPPHGHGRPGTGKGPTLPGRLVTCRHHGRGFTNAGQFRQGEGPSISYMRNLPPRGSLGYQGTRLGIRTRRESPGDSIVPRGVCCLPSPGKHRCPRSTHAVPPASCLTFTSRGSPVQTVGHGLPRPPFGRLWDVRKGCWLWPPGHRPPAAVGCTQRPRDAARAQPVGHVNVHVLGIREKLSDCLSSHRELLTWHGEDLSACGLRTEGRAADPSQAKFKGREGPWCWEGLVGAEGLPRSGRGAARGAGIQREVSSF